jgi:hypothetical protein
MKNIKVVLGVGVVLAVGFAGYKFLSKGKTAFSGDEVILRINGEPALTKDEFLRKVSGMYKGVNPDMIPKDIQRKALDNLISLKVEVKEAEKMGLEKDEEFKKVFEEQINEVREVFLYNAYNKKRFDSIQVSEQELVVEYEKNKSQLIKNPGGCLTYGVAFKNNNHATSFYNQVRNNLDSFESIGRKERDGKFREFPERVNNDTPDYKIPAVVKDSIMRMRTFPSIAVVTAGSETWVVYVQDKKEGEIYELDEIRSQLENQIRYNKLMSGRTENIENLKKLYKIDVEESFFKTEQQPVDPCASGQCSHDQGQEIPSPPPPADNR